MIDVLRVATILYSRRWPDSVAFYRDILGLPTVVEKDWFVELQVGATGFLGVADAARASVAGGDGAGLTLSWQVGDLGATRRQLVEAGVAVSETRSRWGAKVAYIFDPDGYRIELWSGTPSG